MSNLQVKTPEHDKPVFIKAGHVINCAGPLSGKVSQMAGIGDKNTDDPILSHAVSSNSTMHICCNLTILRISRFLRNLCKGLRLGLSS